jgi:hypothetical protein
VERVDIRRAKPGLPLFQAREQIRGHWFELITRLGSGVYEIVRNVSHLVASAGVETWVSGARLVSAGPGSGRWGRPAGCAMAGPIVPRWRDVWPGRPGLRRPPGLRASGLDCAKRGPGRGVCAIHERTVSGAFVRVSSSRTAGGMSTRRYSRGSSCAASISARQVERRRV